jgi:predicted TIM-barrel fold metal-dependent hydrolase
VLNASGDLRAGDDSLKQLETKVQRWGCKGVKLYTAELGGDSRGWSPKTLKPARYLEKCQELGVKNIHVHNGLTIWPLGKDAFDVADLDFAATNLPELEFIVEHVGLPRIENFCFMATQEPNVYAGLVMVVGGLMHVRPRFFAKVMGELRFWLGEDKSIFGADYVIWEPHWQVEGFVEWNMQTDAKLFDYGQLATPTKKKVVGLTAARLYDLEVLAELDLAVPPEPEGAEQLVALASI